MEVGSNASDIIIFEYSKEKKIIFNYNFFELTLYSLRLIQRFSLATRFLYLYILI
jgi:hypothetical protein